MKSWAPAGHFYPLTLPPWAAPPPSSLLSLARSPSPPSLSLSPLRAPSLPLLPGRTERADSVRKSLALRLRSHQGTPAPGPRWLGARGRCPGRPGLWVWGLVSAGLPGTFRLLPLLSPSESEPVSSPLLSPGQLRSCFCAVGHVTQDVGPLPSQTQLTLLVGRGDCRRVSSILSPPQKTSPPPPPPQELSPASPFCNHESRARGLPWRWGRRLRVRAQAPTNTRARALRQCNATGGREPPRRDGARARGGSEGKMAPWVWKSLGVLCTGSGFQ